jgi:hypothetical protein
VSRQLRIRRKPRVGDKFRRLHRAQEAAQASAARAAERINPAAQQARETAALRVTDARRWTAPRLERTAKYVERDLGPRVGSLIHTTADKVKPRRSGNRRRVVAMVLLMAGSVAGALGALARRRNTAPGKPATEQDEKASASADTTAVRDNGQVRTP